MHDVFHNHQKQGIVKQCSLKFNNSDLIRISRVVHMLLIVVFSNFLLGLQMIWVIFLIFSIVFDCFTDPFPLYGFVLEAAE